MMSDILVSILILEVIIALLGIGFAIGYIIGQISCYGKEEINRENQEEN